MTLATVDLVLLAVLIVSAVVGLWRGLTFEVLSLLGWVAAYIAAQALTPITAPHIPIGVAGSALNFGVAFALTFIAALIVWCLLARVVRALVRATPLSAVDRALGALFGLARGGVLLLVVATIVALTPWKNSAAWQHSQLAGASQSMLRAIKPMLPGDLAQHLPA